MPRVDTATAPPERTILDMLDPPETSTSAFAGGNLVYYRRGSTSPGRLAPVWENGSGWVAGRFQGAFWAQAVSAAANRKTRSSSFTPFPISVDAASRPVTARYPQVFQLEALLRRTTPLVALAPLSFSVAWTGGVVSELSDTTSAGYELVSRSDVNGGRWTVRVRLADAGALTVVQDTGIDPATTTILHAAMRLEYTTNPRLLWVLNGLEFGILQGLANLPFAASNSLQVVGLCQGLSVGGGVGQLDNSSQTRYRIIELPGFPT